jgi:hypothetical protein
MQQQVTLPETITTPVRTYLNPETGGKVTLFGLVHLAQEPYFTQARAMTGALQDAGATIYLELITSPEAQQPATDEERWGIGVVKRRLEQVRTQAETLGVVSQRDALPPREGWQIHDLNARAVRPARSSGHAHAATGAAPRIGVRRQAVHTERTASARDMPPTKS